MAINVHVRMATERVQALISCFAGRRILVIGDMVADEYLIGNPGRISREAPVLILNLSEERTVPGGATNVAVNVRTLGAEVLLSGVVGDDLPGHRLRTAIEHLGMNQDGLITDVARPTSTKTRIIAGSTQVVYQHIVRVDRVDTSEVGEPGRGQIVAYIERVLPTVDAVMLSDYENGMISPAVLECCLPLARRLGKIIVVDSHGSFSRFQGVTALTPNQPEAEQATGITITSEEELNEVGYRLLAGSHARCILITRGSEGMSLFVVGERPLHLPVFPLNHHASEIADTNGAGDTVAATFTLALTASASFVEAACLANAAASLVVRRLGCASNTPQELREAFYE
ncbi:MAG TPA: PfkB family carbohydrate kinase [Ktedonobacteraceae bacterium]|jgi:rfaE bifunctional protein kinase chain/domain